MTAQSPEIEVLGAALRKKGALSDAEWTGLVRAFEASKTSSFVDYLVGLKIVTSSSGRSLDAIAKGYMQMEPESFLPEFDLPEEVQAFVGTNGNHAETPAASPNETETAAEAATEEPAPTEDAPAPAPADTAEEVDESDDGPTMDFPDDDDEEDAPAVSTPTEASQDGAPEGDDAAREQPLAERPNADYQDAEPDPEDAWIEEETGPYPIQKDETGDAPGEDDDSGSERLAAISANDDDNDIDLDIDPEDVAIDADLGDLDDGLGDDDDDDGADQEVAEKLSPTSINLRDYISDDDASDPDEDEVGDTTPNRLVSQRDDDPDTYDDTAPSVPAVNLPPEPKPLRVGDTIGDYDLLELLGEGSVGRTFRSHHDRLGIDVAIKVFHPHPDEQDPQLKDHFLAEARTLARLDHPNIVQVKDVNVVDGVPYIVFEKVGVMNLAQVIEVSGTLASDRVAMMGLQVADALTLAYDRGILHRDVKPSNILVKRDGTVKLADFGLASMLNAYGEAEDIRSVGTPSYMAPEQIFAPASVDFRADMYGLGASLYHAVTGFPPLEGETLEETLERKETEVPVPIDEIVVGFDDQVSALIMRLIDPIPDQRFQTWPEVLAAFEQIIDSLTASNSARNSLGRRVSSRIRSYHKSGVYRLPPRGSAMGGVKKSQRSSADNESGALRTRSSRGLQPMNVQSEWFRKSRSSLSSANLNAEGTSGELLGRILGDRYNILKLLGQGGIGRVYKAEDLQLDDVVAVKVFKAETLSEDPLALDRFKQEVKLARKIGHPNVLRLHDFLFADGLAMLTMEYFQGRDLRYLLRKVLHFDTETGMQLMDQIVSGLKAVHQQGIVHRDIKPNNVLINSQGQVKILDFGIARLSDQNYERKTRAGDFIGTPDYVSPEQCLGEETDFRSDIFSLGVLMYESFTGELPFLGENLPQRLLARVNQTPRLPRDIQPDIPPVLDNIIMTCLQREPKHRFENVAELQEALKDIPREES